MKRILGSLLLSFVVLGVTLGATSAASSALTLSAPVVNVATAKTDVCEGVGLTGGNCGDKGTGISTVVKAVINILSVVVGVVAVVMLIIGGLKYITSAGDTSGIASAKNTVIYALVGLVIVAMAQSIVYFVMGKI